MIRVTFFIGNGFDINAGLDTGYPSFYDYYIDQCPDDYLAQKISDDYEFWSDLEEALGKITDEVSPDEEEIFWKSEKNLESKLVEYLERQMSRLDLKSKEKAIALEMQRSLTEFYMELEDNHKRHIADIYNKAGNIVYSFISFNYTDILDRCLEEFRKIMPDNFAQYHNKSKNTIWNTTEDILHIHGTISSDMVLGVNDDAQIWNEKFRKRSTYRESLVKAEQNRTLGNTKTDAVFDIIKGSTIICVFGMSIGQTDKMWWHHICNWLQDNEERRLVIYTLGSKEDTKPELRQKRRDVLVRLQQNSGIFDEEWEQIKEQICVQIVKNDSKRIFNFKVI